MDLHKKLTLAITILLILLVVGAFTYSSVEKWNYLDSLYFTVVTVTTIGYGDLVPQTNIGKIFTMFFAFLGIATVFYFFSTAGKYIFKKAFEKKLEEHSTKLIEKIKSNTLKNPLPKRK